MAEDLPDYENSEERDEAFVRTGFVLIEEGLDADGSHAFRFRYTISRPTALGLMQIITDRIRAAEVQSWGSFTSDDEDPDEDDDEFDYDE